MEIYCPHCEYEFESDEWEGECPSCGAEWWKEWEAWDEEMSYDIYWY
mgnify:CR=1 FL=1